MWYDEAVIYQIYSLGFFGAPFENTGKEAHLLNKISDFIPHIKKLGANCILFNPLFESDTHGYNTRDYRKCDVRLGTNSELKEMIETLHTSGFRVLFDGVFNHAGRGFFAFEDVRKNREASAYRNWFYIDFNGNSPYNDGFWYEGWEGNYDLVKLNLDNPEVSDYLMDSVKFWIDEFGIDGLRLDVAYMVNRNFLKRLHYETLNYKSDFFLLGEILGGDYKQIMNNEMCHSATNYECYKGIYSSLNSGNLFEIVHSLLRQFGKDPWCLYTGMNLVSFVDNHDVTRIASVLNNEKHLPLSYALMFLMPGIPSIYYGSEWGTLGNKSDGDQSLRPSFEKPEWNGLCDFISNLSEIRRSSRALMYGDFRSLVLENLHCLFERNFEGERILLALNIEENPYVFHTDFNAGCAENLLTGETVDFGGGLELPGYSAMVLRI